jgi:hypothetical protein
VHFPGNGAAPGSTREWARRPARGLDVAEEKMPPKRGSCAKDVPGSLKLRWLPHAIFEASDPGSAKMFAIDSSPCILPDGMVARKS